MEGLKKILRRIDFFGVFFTFRFNRKESYSTSLGGLIILLFCIFAIYLGIYNFIAFIDRVKFNTIYYTMNIPKTERITLKESKASFTIGFECYDDERFKVNDLFVLNDILDLKKVSIIHTTELKHHWAYIHAHTKIFIICTIMNLIV